MGVRPRPEIHGEPHPARLLGDRAQKSGTSWLHCNLKAHPDTFLPEPKEVHYFDQKFEQGLDSYAAVFREGAAKTKGEITPAYGILSPERIRFIRRVMPEVRLIFLMRNPIDRAWSHSMMSLVWQVGRRYEDVSEAEFLEHFRGEANASRGDYETTIDRWTAEFPRERLFLGFFDDVAARPRELLTDVFRHLGLKTDVDWSTFPVREVIYKGADVPVPSRFREVLTEMYAPKIERPG